MITKCICYLVDPRLLNAGIPVEQLERKDEHEFISGETIEHLNRYASGTQRLCGLKSTEYYPKPPEQLEIELGLSDYSKVLSGELINISADTAKHHGQKFKVKNKGTTSYVMRILLAVGKKGYFR
ncbi:hypothetical protein LC605_24075 [Nostoc sp. CHAB 5836]|uniref:hypothetical protein n=1 Tax=Nostoc sp. CHAB 5836 TaxID=2780404 RepID=UPI001E5026C4|nr:hypothetical protein [Nostoc sp. CHAB 5836]MCC5618106.1 hypothetical protein [Nostoc sp. CHAB 5836]